MDTTRRFFFANVIAGLIAGPAVANASLLPVATAPPKPLLIDLIEALGWCPSYEGRLHLIIQPEGADLSGLMNRIYRAHHEANRKLFSVGTASYARHEIYDSTMPNWSGVTFFFHQDDQVHAVAPGGYSRWYSRLSNGMLIGDDTFVIWEWPDRLEFGMPSEPMPRMPPHIQKLMMAADTVVLAENSHSFRLWKNRFVSKYLFDPGQLV